MTGPALLDLFCGAGGAGMGYALAGFNVTGVDIAPQPRYPFRFIRGDALEYARALGEEYHAVHASPPCKTHTPLRGFAGAHHVSLIEQTRRALDATGRPWVIENVPGAPLIEPVTLCGAMFALGAHCEDGAYRYLCRHRLFEANWNLRAPDHPDHPPYQAIGVYGHGRNPALKRNYMANRAEGRAALGAPWMSTRELSQAIPPAYTRHVGTQLLAALS